MCNGSSGSSSYQKLRKTIYIFTDGGNDEGKLLMTAKMNFWATACPKHENILQFIGAVTSGTQSIVKSCIVAFSSNYLNWCPLS